MATISRRQLGALAGAPFALRPAEAAEAPNVVIVLTDDQGYGDLACHGHPLLKTPVLDRLHGESVRFTDFHSSAMCTPTRAQLMTGRNAMFTRAMNVSSGRTMLRRDLPTLAEAFAANGYRTGIFGKWHLGDNYPYRPEDRGFNEALWFPSSHIGAVPDYWNNDYFNDHYRHNGKVEPFKGYCTDIFFDNAMSWMRAQKDARRRFFTYLPLNSAHGPLYVPPEFRAPYKDLPESEQRFYGMVANIDHHMGRLEDMLRTSGLRDNTILIWATDNGGTNGVRRYNAGMRGQKIGLHDGGHRVPFFVRWPAAKIGGGRDVDELAQFQDVFPTLIDLCGLRRTANAKFDGVSLAPLLKGQAKSLAERTLFVQFSRMQDSFPKKNDTCVMRKKWRLVTGNELYDISNDRGQEKNLFKEKPEIAQSLQRDYDEWWKTIEPLIDKFMPVHVGNDHENPTMLSACEWADVFLDQQAQVRRGDRKIGKWYVEVEKAGEYEIGLRRWPKEANLPLNAVAPVHNGEDGVKPAGVAIPIAGARLKVANFDETKKTETADTEATFRVKLPAGPAVIETWFLDSAGQSLLSAYYAYVERK